MLRQYICIVISFQVLLVVLVSPEPQVSLAHLEELEQLDSLDSWVLLDPLDRAEILDSLDQKVVSILCIS